MKHEIESLVRDAFCRYELKYCEIQNLIKSDISWAIINSIFTRHFLCRRCAYPDSRKRIHGMRNLMELLKLENPI